MAAFPREFKLGDIVSVGNNGEKGKIVDIYQPLGTYNMYKVQSRFDGRIINAARHELVKGLPDDDFREVLETTGLNESDDEIISATELLEHSSPAITSDTATFQTAVNVPTSETPAPAQSSATNPSAQAQSVQDSQKSVPKSRFVPMAENDIEKFISDSENMNTRRKTLCHVNLVKDFLCEKGIKTPIEQLSPYELNNHLMNFFVSFRQKNGSEYEPVTLRSMLGSLERYLKRHRYGYSVISGLEFSKTRDALKSKQKDLKSKGFGNQPKTADDITSTEMQFLHEKGQLGTSTPQSLMNTLWLNNTMYFGMRAGTEEHRNLKWGDVTLNYDYELKIEYLQLNERQTKTRTGEDVKVKRRGGMPCMYAAPDNVEQCPVHTYKVYADKRPSDFSDPDTPFYLACNTIKSRPLPGDQWFLRGPVGRNKITGLLKSMVVNAGLPSFKSKRLCNTSVRKHLCQELLDKNVPDTLAVHVTGHKNPATLNNYRKPSNMQKFQMSNILTKSKCVSGSTSSEIIPQHNSHSPAQLPTMQIPCQLNQSASIDVRSSQISHEATVSGSLHSLFSGSTIHGGTFNINMHFHKT